MKYLFYLFVGISFLGCTEPSEDILVVQGVKPLYLAENTFDVISSEVPKPFERTGKIYQYGSYLYISDRGTGVHVIDNTDPSNPIKIAFISIPGNFDMLARFDAMYADSGNDLVTIDMSDLDNAQEVHRIENVYPGAGDSYPMFYSGYFECVDPAKGIVYDWEEATLTNPKCER